jgi:membrane-associated phospholipid phosphatase
LGAVIVIAIGVGRVVLNVHHPSDVLAGWALGYAYFVACLLMLPPTRPITEADETPAAPDIAR